MSALSDFECLIALMSSVSSGGYNIKAVPVATIELMKKDMGGAAAVFGAAKVLGQIKPPGVEVLQIQLLVAS